MDFPVNTQKIPVIYANGRSVPLFWDCRKDRHGYPEPAEQICSGDHVELVGPDMRPFSFEAPVMQDENGACLTEPKTPQMRFSMQLPQPVPPYSILRRAVDLSAR